MRKPLTEREKMLRKLERFFKKRAAFWNAMAEARPQGKAPYCKGRGDSFLAAAADIADYRNYKIL